MFLVLTSCNIGRWDGVILIVMNIEMEEEIKKMYGVLTDILL